MGLAVHAYPVIDAGVSKTGLAGLSTIKPALVAGALLQHLHQICPLPDPACAVLHSPCYG